MEPDRTALYGLYQLLSSERLRLVDFAQAGAGSPSQITPIRTTELEETTSARDIALRLVTEKDPDPAKASAALGKLRDMSQLRNQVLAEQAKQAARSTVASEILAHLDREERRLLREFVGVVEVGRLHSTHSPQLVTGEQDYLLGHFSECMGVNPNTGLPIVLKVRLDPGETQRLAQIQKQLMYSSRSGESIFSFRAKMKHSVTVAIGGKEVAAMSAQLYVQEGTMQVPYRSIAAQDQWELEVIDAVSLAPKRLTK